MIRGVVMSKLLLEYDLDDYIFNIFNVEYYQTMSIKELNNLAKQGDLNAYYGLAYKYNCGDEVNIDRSKSIKLLKEGYDKGSDFCGAVWIRSEYIFNINPDFEKAVEETKKLLDKKCGDALSLYAIMLFFGIGVDVDAEKAENIFNYCVSKNSGFSLLNYLDILDSKNVIYKSYSSDVLYDIDARTKYFELVKKYTGNKYCGVGISLYLYKCYKEGIGTDIAVEKALEVCNEVLKKTPKNFKFNYFALEAYYKLNRYCEESVTCAKNIIKKPNNKKASMLAYKFLSFSYMYGYGVRKNHKLSHDYAVRAIQLGDIGALGCLAQLYRMGWYVEKNIEKAKELLNESFRHYSDFLWSYIWAAEICIEEKDYKTAQVHFTHCFERYVILSYQNPEFEKYLRARIDDIKGF